MEDYAVFVCNDVPVIAKLNSILYRKLLERGKWCITGAIESCVKLADDVLEMIMSEREA